MNELSHIDLNMLVALKVLLEVRSVSLAAQQLHTSQPTMSRYLAKLRNDLNDPLLVRSDRAYILTEKAQYIRERLDSLFTEIKTIFSDDFAPDMMSKEFVVAAPDYVVKYVLCDILTLLITMDIKARFTIENWNSYTKSKLINGDIHLAISLDNKFPSNIIKRVIDEDSFVVVARPEHPIAREKELSLNSFLAHSFVDVVTGGGWQGHVEKPLRALKLTRDVKLNIYSYEDAFNIVSRTDLLLIVPHHVAANSEAAKGLLTKPLPLDIPKAQYCLWWHEVHQNDAAHKWLRNNFFPKILTHPYQLSLQNPENKN